MPAPYDKKGGEASEGYRWVLSESVRDVAQVDIRATTGKLIRNCSLDEYMPEDQRHELKPQFTDP